MYRKMTALLAIGLASTSLYGLTASVKTNTANNNYQSNNRVQNRTASTPTSSGEPQTVIINFIKAWNNHDPKAMAALWVEDGDLLDPWGKMASGKRQVERAFTSDQTGRFKDSSISLSIEGVRFLGNDVAIVDASGSVSNAKNPDGSGAPVLEHHVLWVMQKQGGGWKVVSARPYIFIPKPAAGSMK